MIRLLKFLSYIQQLQPAEIACVPPTSIIREFLGGSSFIYRLLRYPQFGILFFSSLPELEVDDRGAVGFD